MYVYDPRADSILDNPTYTIQHVVEVSDESVEKIADAVVRKLTDQKSDVPDTNVGDMISRQDAIDEIRKCRFVVDAIEKIRGLPPKIIRCKDCKHKNVYRFPPKYDGRDYCEKHGKVVDVADFCSWAERRTDEID